MDLGIRGLGDAIEIGTGGFAVVYRAPQPAFDRMVAVKVFGHLNVDDATLTAFRRECVAIGRIADRANIVTVHDQGLTDSGLPYLIMAYMARGSLGDRIYAEGPIPWPEAVEIGRKLARALQAAHDAGILHRDIKPANVLMGDDYEPQLADFGIARLVDSSQQTEGSTAFTAAYAPPEVVAGKKPTAAGDIYSLACTLFTAMAGKPAFVEGADDSVVAILNRVATLPPPDLLRPANVPLSVRRVIEGAMAKDPSARPATAAAFAAALESARTEAEADTEAATETHATTVPIPIPPDQPVDG